VEELVAERQAVHRCGRRGAGGVRGRHGVGLGRQSVWPTG
jgi:hypothetical protein